MKIKFPSPVRLAACLVFFLLGASGHEGNAQTTFPFSASPNLSIPDNGYNGTLGSMASSTVTATGLPLGQVTNIEVSLALTHSWVGDLTVKLQSPDGTILGLLSRPGYAELTDNGSGCCGSNANMDGGLLRFGDAFTNDAETMAAGLGDADVVCTTNGICSFFPNPGSIATPPSSFSELHSGSTNGAWTLYVGDSEAGDVGTLVSWELRITLIPYFVCETGIGCQASDPVNAWRSDASAPELRSEGFVAQASGAVSAVCWYGAYFDQTIPGDCASGQADNFTVTYYRNDDGEPGTVLAGPFAVTANRQIAGDIVAGSAVEYGYEASHPPVNLIAGQGYWISIVNNQPGNCNWYWSQGVAGDGISHRIISGSPETPSHDLSFCLNVPINSNGILSAAPNNDVCSIATPINCGEVHTGSTAPATLQDAPAECGSPLSTAPGVWFSFAGTGATVKVSTCNAGTSFDTKLGVFSGSCGALSCIVGNDDIGAECSASAFRSSVTFCTTAGETYYIYLTGFGTSNGDYELSLECLTGPAPANDLCVNALVVQTNSTSDFDNEQACTDGPFANMCGNAQNAQADLWYSYTADVNCPVTVSVCGSSFNTMLGVYDGSNGCPFNQSAFVCNDDFCGTQSQLTFTPVLGNTYLIRVAGKGGARGTGTLSVSASDTEDPVILNCPSSISVNADAGSCVAFITIPVPQFGTAFSDNCVATISNDFTGTSNASGTYPVGVTTVVWTATDPTGNAATCNQSVTVVDSELPIISCQNVTVGSTAGQCGETVTYAHSISDNCPGATLTTSVGSGSFFPVGTTQVTVTGSDTHGNAALPCIFNITVIDTEDPVFSGCPSNISVSVDAAADCSAPATWTPPNAADNCSVTVISSHQPGDIFAQGTTVITYTATDGSGRTATCSFSVTVTCDPIDCNGVTNGTAFLDNCNICVGGNTGLTACLADCNGDFGGTAFLDNCNICVGGNTGLTACLADCNTGLTACVADCNGDFGGTAFLDNCNICVGGNTGLTACVADCNGDFGGTASLDNCNICVGGNTGLTACPLDCNGEDGGAAYFDNCGICVGGSTGLQECVADCNGDFGGAAFLDECSDCVGGNTGLDPCIVIGADDRGQNSRLVVYPNPNNGQFIVEFSGPEGTGTLRIRDMMGRNVFSQAVNISGTVRQSIDLNVAQGTYVLQLITEKGITTRKVELR